MASSGGDVDWGGVQKVLISASQSSFKTCDISILVDCILKSKKELLEHEDKYESFYSCVVSLSTHYITNCAYCLPKSKLSKVVNACHILMNFCLQRMLKYYEFCAVSQRNLMSLIEGLCTGCGQLQRSNIITLTAMLKSSQMPPSSSKSKATDSAALIKVSEMKTQSQTEFLETLMSSFSEISPNSGSISAVRTRVDNIKEEQEVYENIYQPGMNIDSKTFFAARNIDNLHSLGGGDILLDVCLNLSFLLRYIGYYQDAVKGNQFILPGSISEVVSMKNSYQSLLNDMSIVSRVLSLPILEPLTPSHLEKLTTIIMSCLYAAVAAVSSHTILNIASLHQIKGLQVVKDSDHEKHAKLIVKKGLAMFSTLSSAIQSSIRAGGHNLQNLNMLGAWCIFRGLEHILNLNATSIPEKKDREGGTSPLPKSEKPTFAKTKDTPIRPSSAKGYQSLLNDMSIVSRVLSLPILEPLTPSHLEKLTTIIMSCLYAAVAAVSSHTILNIASLHQIKGLQVVKDSDHEKHAKLIVKKGLAMFSTLSSAIQSSIRAGGHNLQNLNMLGAWCIFRGLEHILNLNATSIPEKKDREGGTSPLPKSEKPTFAKTKDTPIRPSSAKGLQGFSSLTVALANKGLSLFKTLMDDLHIESLTQVSQRQSEVAEISIAPQNTASMRVKGILEGADVINFLFGLFIFGYRKACSIVRSKKDQAGTTDDSYSDSNSEINEDYEDEFSSSEDSSEDDDSEPLFGHLFHDNLSPNEDSKEIPPPPPLPRAPGKGEDGKASKSESPNIMDLPDTEEPAVYLRLSTETLQFMTTYLLKSSNEFIQSYYRASVTDVHLMNLAGVIKDLDKEMIKIDNGSLMEEFSSALSRFTHCLVASGLLSNSLQ
ncbi:E3 ubiquitin-protein ligase UBR4-like, partial [Anneissia japonica]|uniref:E3 ubiquitin-protein ligase UBR4-like n=1 Tax=Anneissia japonica TaxID=1529436 RepID=UPI00142589B6